MEDFYSRYLASLRQLRSNNFSQSFVPVGANIFCGEILDFEFCDHTVKRVKEHIHNKNKLANITLGERVLEWLKV